MSEVKAGNVAAPDYEYACKLLTEELDLTNNQLKKAKVNLEQVNQEKAQFREDYATLERQHQSVVADRNQLETQSKSWYSAYEKIKAERDEENINYNKEVEKLRTAAQNHLANLKSEQTANNELRQLLMQSQLDYARICGYVDGMLDARPKRMVEADDKTGLDRIKDNSWGPSQTFRHSDGSKAWYQK